MKLPNIKGRLSLADLPPACLALAGLPAEALAAKVQVTVTHALAQARPAETIAIPWAEVKRLLPGALL